MSSLPAIDDLRLVVGVSRTGSVGGAARLLQVSQPSASARLARLERRCGTTLFDRDTTGARPTAAGLEFARQAQHILGHLEGIVPAVRTASEDRPLVVGTFASLTSLLFPSLDMLLPGVPLQQFQDHGNVLIDWVAEGTMDAAFVAIAEQVSLPTGVASHSVGTDPLVLFRSSSVPPAGRGRFPLKGRPVVVSTYDMRADELRERLERLGAHARRAVTLATGIAMARRREHLAVLPRSAVAHDLRPGETIDRLPFNMSMELTMITGRNPDNRMVEMLPALRRELGLRRPVSRADGAARQPSPRG